VSGLGHFLEDEGLPTVQLSLIREHTEAMRAPRALWVPFMLGRPLGVPGDPYFQKRVLRDAMKLLEAPSGPVLEDFPEEAPETDIEEDGWVCPISFQREKNLGLAERLRREIQQYRAWYDLGTERRGRTCFGVSGLDLEALGIFLVSVAEGGEPLSPTQEVDVARMLRLSIDDLRTFFYEAAEAQPGSATPKQLDEWFWTSTTAGEVILKLWQRAKESDDKAIRRLSNLVVPRDWFPKSD